MSARKPSLGRNLDALLGVAPTVVASNESEQHGRLKILPVDIIQRGKYQPRQEMGADALEELADSIRAQGVIQPIVVRAISSNKYEIIAGERRWRATQMAGLSEIPALIKEIGDEETIAMALIENIQREDLNALEEARAFDRLAREFSHTHEQIAEAVGKSRATISNLLRLLSLHADVQRMLENGDLEQGHAKVILSLDENKQFSAAMQIVNKGLSVREAEKLVKQLQNPAPKRSHKEELDPDTKNLQDTVSEKLGAKVIIQHTAQGKGKLVIHYNSLDELDGVLEHIK